MRVGGYHLEPHYQVLTVSPSARFRLHDGHLPAYMPVVAGDQLFAAMERQNINIAELIY